MGWVEMISLWIFCILFKNNFLWISVGIKNMWLKKKREREKKREFGYLYKFSLNLLMNMIRDWFDFFVYVWLNRLFFSIVIWIN